MFTTLPNEAFRIHPEDAHTLSIVTGLSDAVFEYNPNQIVYRHALFNWRWMVCPESVFRDEFPNVPIQDSRIPSE